MPSRTITLISANDDRLFPVDVLDEGVQREVRIEQQIYSVTNDGRGSMRITIDRPSRATRTAWSVKVGDVRWVFVGGRVYELSEARPLARSRSGHHGSLTAPMPATVRRVLVSVGDEVKRGDTLVILEAMKMELPVRASAAGTISAVRCREGELVQPGVTLIEIDDK